MEKILHDAKRNPREDLVTSSLFGMLRRLSPNSRQAALSILCAYAIPSDATIYLWPFFAGKDENSEPDVVLEFMQDGRTAFWIVEVKWGAPLCLDQCAREIRTVNLGRRRGGGVPENERNVLGYTLLGAEPHHQKAMAELRRSVLNGLIGVPVEGIRSLEWTAVVESLRTLESQAGDRGFQSWSRLSLPCLPTLDRLKAGVSSLAHGGGLVAPSGKCSALGTLYPTALWGLSSL